MTWKTGPEPRVPAGILATHLDRSLQLSYKLVMDALGHLRLQLVEALVIVSEPLEAGGRRNDRQMGALQDKGPWLGSQPSKAWDPYRGAPSCPS